MIVGDNDANNRRILSDMDKSSAIYKDDCGNNNATNRKISNDGRRISTDMDESSAI